MNELGWEDRGTRTSGKEGQILTRTVMPGLQVQHATEEQEDQVASRRDPAPGYSGRTSTLWCFR